jgi:hypothetical protein
MDLVECNGNTGFCRRCGIDWMIRCDPQGPIAFIDADQGSVPHIH